MDDARAAMLANERVEIHHGDFRKSSLLDDDKIEKMLKLIDVSIKKMLFPGATIILELMTLRRRKEKRLTNYIEISNYNNEGLKRVLHDKIKNALNSNFKEKDRGCKICVWYEQIILYSPSCQETSLSI